MPFYEGLGSTEGHHAGHSRPARQANQIEELLVNLLRSGRQVGAAVHPAQRLMYAVALDSTDSLAHFTDLGAVTAQLSLHLTQANVESVPSYSGVAGARVDAYYIRDAGEQGCGQQAHVLEDDHCAHGLL